MVVAGELSGDLLGGALIEALLRLRPGLRFEGVTGPRMRAAGCASLDDIESLSLMGIAEVLPAIPRLLKLRGRLIAHALASRPALIVGIDAPDFNLGLETRLRRAGLRTVHVVSPTVWAWRQGRVKTIAAAVEQIFCLFPFEPAFYAQAGVAAHYIGHPLADELDARTGAVEARQALGLDPQRPCLAVLPGSRTAEIHHLMPTFVAAAQQLCALHPQLQLVTPVARPTLRAAIEQALAAASELQPRWRLLDGGSRQAMQAADAVLLASGTATLECLLLGRPMVVAYKSSAFNAWLMLRMGLLKSRFVSLPNLLADQAVVPELLQEAASPEALCSELDRLLSDASAAAAQCTVFDRVRAELRCDSALQAAQQLLRLLDEPR